jgi:uncharacterized Fe-S cluster protein YjdI
MTVVTKEDCLDSGFCIRGQMRFFRAHRLDWTAYYRDGIPVEKLAGIDDLNMTRAIEKAKAREEGSSS